MHTNVPRAHDLVSGKISEVATTLGRTVCFREGDVDSYEPTQDDVVSIG
jgi:hypothetical protein